MSIFKNLKILLKIQYIIIILGYFGEMEQNGLLYYLYY